MKEYQIKKTPYRNISDQTTILYMILYNPYTVKRREPLYCSGSRLFFQSSNSASCLRIAPVAALILKLYSIWSDLNSTS